MDRIHTPVLQYERNLIFILARDEKKQDNNI